MLTLDWNSRLHGRGRLHSAGVPSCRPLCKSARSAPVQSAIGTLEPQRSHSDNDWLTALTAIIGETDLTTTTEQHVQPGIFIEFHVPGRLSLLNPCPPFL